jgi:hypothetical protein
VTARLHPDDLAAVVEQTALRVVELLREEPAPAPSRSPLVDAATVARALGISRSTVYGHAAELGAVPIGDGPKPRLRFDLDRARQAWGSRSEGEGSGALQPARRRRSRRPPRRVTGTGVPLLPVANDGEEG